MNKAVQNASIELNFYDFVDINYIVLINTEGDSI